MYSWSKTVQRYILDQALRKNSNTWNHLFTINVNNGTTWNLYKEHNVYYSLDELNHVRQVVDLANSWNYKERRSRRLETSLSSQGAMRISDIRKKKKRIHERQYHNIKNAATKVSPRLRRNKVSRQPNKAYKISRMLTNGLQIGLAHTFTPWSPNMQSIDATRTIHQMRFSE